MGSVKIDMVHPPAGPKYTQLRWTPEGIRAAANRARKTGKFTAGHKITLSRSNPFYAVAIQGKGLRWEERGQQKVAQIWCPGPYDNSYWMIVYSPLAYFPGEMRLAQGNPKTQGLGIDSKIYNSRGDQAHRNDGSACFGGQRLNSGDFGCPGCLRDKIDDACRELAGLYVKIKIEGDPAFGPVLRWGNLKGLDDGRLLVDDMHDSNGIRDTVPSIGLEHVLDLVAA